MVQTFVLIKVQRTKWQKDWTLKTSSEKLTLTCVNMHSFTFHKSGFTSKITMKYQREQGFQSLSVLYPLKDNNAKVLVTVC